jgi:predicted nucleic acid-binding protein
VARLVLSDASPLIGLAIVGGLAWLGPLFGEVWIPRRVRQEVLAGGVPRGQREIETALTEGALRLWEKPVPPADLPDLDEGEADCIRIGMTHAGDVLILMDERAGRIVAGERGLRVAGTAAVIGLAKTRGLIDSAWAALERMHRSDFRISAEVIRAVLTRVGESAPPR